MDIPNEVKEQVKEALSSLEKKVILKIFTSKSNCDYCNDTVALCNAVAELSDNVSTQTLDIESNKDVAEKFNVKLTPTILVHSETKEWPIRFNGIPGGHEFGSLIESIRLAGTENLNIPEDVAQKVKSINKPTNIKAFVTVSCPYCPPAVLTGFQFAMLNPEFITAEMVEASQFPDLSRQFQVSSVPHVVINDSISFVGSLAPDKYIEKILEA